MAYIMVDIESDGPIPGDYSMISFGAVLVNEQLDKTFYGKLKPISEKYIPEALAVSGFPGEETPPSEIRRKELKQSNNGTKKTRKNNPTSTTTKTGSNGMSFGGIFTIS